MIDSQGGQGWGSGSQQGMGQEATLICWGEDTEERTLPWGNPSDTGSTGEEKAECGGKAIIVR